MADLKRMMEIQYTAILEKLSAAAPADRIAVLQKMQTLSEMQDEYERLRARFEEMFGGRGGSTDVVITEGAVTNRYLNLKKALAERLIAPETEITISFPDTGLPDVTSQVIERSGFLQSRAAAKAFFDHYGGDVVGRSFRLEKTGANTYSIRLIGSARRRRPPFTFSMCGIGIGEKIVSLERPDVVCTVKDDRHILWQGEVYSMSALAQRVLGTDMAIQGTKHFTYHGVILDDLRRRMEPDEMLEEDTEDAAFSGDMLPN